MIDSAALVCRHIQDMPAYEPVLPFDVLSAQLGLPVEKLIKLDANENPYGPLPEVARALADLSYLHIYPDPESRHLRAALGQYLDIPMENILAGAGADELIDLMMRLLIEPGDAVINCPPSFGMYPFDSDLNRARLISVPRNKDFKIDLEQVRRAVWEHKPKLMFLASPNNPDGGLISREELAELLELPLMVVLDQAYVEFAPAQANFIQAAPGRNNLIVLRTFSKWAGLAGLRVGYGVFPTCLMPYLWKIKQPYNISVAATAAAEISLQHADQLDRIGRRITAERQRLYEALQKLEWLRPYPSFANFILCRVVGKDAGRLKALLARAGILVRYYRTTGLQDHIRISIGRSEDSDKVLDILKEIE